MKPHLLLFALLFCCYHCFGNQVVSSGFTGDYLDASSTKIELNSDNITSFLFSENDTAINLPEEIYDDFNDDILLNINDERLIDLEELFGPFLGYFEFYVYPAFAGQYVMVTFGTDIENPIILPFEAGFTGVPPADKLVDDPVLAEALYSTYLLQDHLNGLSDLDELLELKNYYDLEMWWDTSSAQELIIGYYTGSKRKSDRVRIGNMAFWGAGEIIKAKATGGASLFGLIAGGLSEFLNHNMLDGINEQDIQHLLIAHSFYGGDLSIFEAMEGSIFVELSLEAIRLAKAIKNFKEDVELAGHFINAVEYAILGDMAGVDLEMIEIFNSIDGALTGIVYDQVADVLLSASGLPDLKDQVKTYSWLHDAYFEAIHVVLTDLVQITQEIDQILNSNFNEENVKRLPGLIFDIGQKHHFVYNGLLLGFTRMQLNHTQFIKQENNNWTAWFVGASNDNISQLEQDYESRIFTYETQINNLHKFTSRKFLADAVYAGALALIKDRYANSVRVLFEDDAPGIIYKGEANTLNIEIKNDYTHAISINSISFLHNYEYLDVDYSNIPATIPAQNYATVPVTMEVSELWFTFENPEKPNLSIELEWQIEGQTNSQVYLLDLIVNSRSKIVDVVPDKSIVRPGETIFIDVLYEENAPGDVDALSSYLLKPDGAAASVNFNMYPEDNTFSISYDLPDGPFGGWGTKKYLHNSSAGILHTPIVYSNALFYLVPYILPENIADFDFHNFAVIYPEADLEAAEDVKEITKLADAHFYKLEDHSNEYLEDIVHNQDVILIGGHNANPFTGELDQTSLQKEGDAIINFYPEAFSNSNAIVIAGYSLRDTQIAAMGFIDQYIEANPETISPPIITDVTQLYDKILIEWQPSPDITVTHYNIYRNSNDLHTVVLADDDTYYIDSVGFGPNKTYNYRIKAVNHNGTMSSFSNRFRLSYHDHNGKPCNGMPYFTDPRDGQTYATLQIGGKCWTKENMRYLPTVFGRSGSWVREYQYVYDFYGSSPLEATFTDNYNTYGVLYNPHAAKKACPPGWQLPTYYTDWAYLKSELIDKYTSIDENNIGNALKSCRQLGSPLGGECDTELHPRWDEDTDHYGTDMFGFGAMPGGQWSYNTEFSGKGQAARFASLWFSQPSQMVLTYDGGEFIRLSGGDGLSVRCVKSAEDLSAEPTVITSELILLNPFEATAGGLITDDGGHEIMGKGVIWSRLPAASFNNFEGYTYDGMGDGEFVSEISGLLPSTTYYMRAFAMNNLATAYGEEIVFTTPEIIDGDPCIEMATYTDDRDGNVYNTVQIGNQCYFQENLKYLPAVSPPEDGSTTSPHYYVYDYYGNSVSQAKNTDNYENYGVLYNYPAASTACPEGWTLLYDYPGLVYYLEDRYAADLSYHSTTIEDALRSCRQVDSPLGGECDTDIHPRWNIHIRPGLDLFNYSALPGGLKYSDFSGLGWDAVWWLKGAYTKMYFGYFSGYDFGLSPAPWPFSNALSVRCVRASKPNGIDLKAINVTQSTANVSISITDDGGSPLTGKGVVWSTEPHPSLENNEGHIHSSSSAESFIAELNNLDPNTRYYVRSYASNIIGNTYGQEIHISTLPLLSTMEVTDIRSYNAKSGVIIETGGAANIKAVGLLWSTSSMPDLDNNEGLTMHWGGVGEFESCLFDLIPETDYYLRSFAINDWGFVYGNQLEFSTISESEFECGVSTVFDADCNEYQTIKIGLQCWTENIKATRNPAGFPIIRHCYDDDVENCEIYGGLYDWNTGVNGAPGSNSNPSMVRGLCPDGWHLPSHDEWSQLEYFLCMYLGEEDCLDTDVWYNYQNEGNLLKSCRQVNSPLGGDCDTSERPRWDYSPSHYGTDDFGFTALPAGVRTHLGESIYMDQWALLMSSSRASWQNAWNRSIYYEIGYLSGHVTDKQAAVSIRCVRDEENLVLLPTIQTNDVTDITYTTAVSGGEILANGGDIILNKGLVWCTTPEPTLTQNDGFVKLGRGEEDFSYQIVGLSPETTYYVRSFAINAAGTQYGNEIMFETIPDDSTVPCPGMPTVMDVDGNLYNTVLIGDQCWLKENLRVTSYNNGDIIATGLSNSEWSNTQEGAFAIYPYTVWNAQGIDSPEEMVDAYGKLYNWHAVSDERGLCPTGWLVPTADDFATLTHYVDPDGTLWSNRAGSQLRSCRQVNALIGGECDTETHPRWNEYTCCLNLYTNGYVSENDNVGFDIISHGTLCEVESIDIVVNNGTILFIELSSSQHTDYFDYSQEAENHVFLDMLTIAGSPLTWMNMGVEILPEGSIDEAFIEVEVMFSNETCSETFDMSWVTATDLKEKNVIDDKSLRTSLLFFDNYGFSGLPAGVRQTNGSYFSLGHNTFWWSSTLSSEDRARTALIQINNPDLQQSSLGSLLNSGYSIRCIRDEDYVEIPSQIDLFDEFIPAGEEVCYDAAQTITTGGDGPFIVESGGSATLIAGESIHLLPGTTVEYGGYLLARIAQNEDDYCGIPRAIDIAKEPVASKDDDVVSADFSYEIRENGFFKLYPNPTDGTFTLELTTAELEQEITVEVHSLLGGRLFTKELPPQRLHTLSLEGQQPGMYIIRVTKGDKLGIERLIKR